MLKSLSEDLQRWGPGSDHSAPFTVSEAEAYTRKVAHSHYENFPVVTWFLPAELRQPFYNVYAFCRWADDLGDELDSPAQSLEMLAWWRQELELCTERPARHPVYRALAETIEQFSLPKSLFHDLITAFERDQHQTRYPTYADLLDYCCYSANPVGRILLHLTHSATPDCLKLSDDLCTGLQLINFWQDVARDWQIGRVYLPQEDLIRWNVSEAVLAGQVSTLEFRELLKFEVDRAEQLLQNGFKLGRLVPRKIRFDIRLFALGGLCLCRKIRALDYRVLEQRPKLQKSDLPGLAWKALRGQS